MSHVNSKFQAIAYTLLALFAITACTNQMEPAKKAIAGIEAAVAAAGIDAQKYIPDQLKTVTDQLAALKSKFDQKDYAGVLAAAPGLLTQAQGLLAAKDTAVKEAAAQAAAAQAAAEEALKTSWGALESTVPQAIAAVDSRVAILAKSKKLPANITTDALASAQSNLADAKSLWQQATTSQTAGKLNDAVASAQQAKQQIYAALAGLGMSGG